MIDLLPDRWTTASQCIRHWFNREYDLPTIEPRPAEAIRIASHQGAAPLWRRRQGFASSGWRPIALLAAEGRESLPNNLFVCRCSVRSKPARYPRAQPGFSGALRLDLFCHWNLDRTGAVQTQLHFLDSVIERLCAQAERLGLKALLVVDHGQERVRHTLNLCRILRALNSELLKKPLSDIA